MENSLRKATLRLATEPHLAHAFQQDPQELADEWGLDETDLVMLQALYPAEEPVVPGQLGR
jgi:hypothetical protein